MDAIDYTPPTTQEREFLDWAMAQHKAKRGRVPEMSRRELNAAWIAYCLHLLREEDRNDA